MNIYAYISIHSYFDERPFFREYYKLTNKDGFYYWKSVEVYEASFIKLAYQINIAISSSDISYYKYNEIPDITFCHKHLECPLIER